MRRPEEPRETHRPRSRRAKVQPPVVGRKGVELLDTHGQGLDEHQPGGRRQERERRVGNRARGGRDRSRRADEGSRSRLIRQPIDDASVHIGDVAMHLGSPVPRRGRMNDPLLSPPTSSRPSRACGHLSPTAPIAASRSSPSGAASPSTSRHRRGAWRGSSPSGRSSRSSTHSPSSDDGGACRAATSRPRRRPRPGSRWRPWATCSRGCGSSPPDRRACPTPRPLGCWGCQSPSVSCVFMLAPTGWFRSSSTGSYLCPAPVPAGPLRWSTRPANSATGPQTPPARPARSRRAARAASGAPGAS